MNNPQTQTENPESPAILSSGTGSIINFPPPPDSAAFAAAGDPSKFPIDAFPPLLRNGSGNTTPSNAFAVLHNGNTTISGNLAISGVITGNVTYARRQGDIIMGTYGNGNGD